MEAYEKEQRWKFLNPKIKKRYLKIKVRGGYRYFTKRYLKVIISLGTCKIFSETSFLNAIWEYNHIFIPNMKSEGWSLQRISIFPEESVENFSDDVKITK